MIPCRAQWGVGSGSRVYGPHYYASGDCYWLGHRAITTGDPYWGDRYNACRYYY